MLIVASSRPQNTTTIVPLRGLRHRPCFLAPSIHCHCHCHLPPPSPFPLRSPPHALLETSILRPRETEPSLFVRPQYFGSFYHSVIVYRAPGWFSLHSLLACSPTICRFQTQRFPLRPTPAFPASSFSHHLESSRIDTSSIIYMQSC